MDVNVIINGITNNFLEIVVAVISLVTSYYIIPCIKDNLIPWLKEKRLYDITNKFVRAAEKMANSGLIQKCEKKEKVISLLKENGITVDETLEAFIESACEDLDLITNTIYEEIVEEDEENTNKTE